MKLFNQVLIEGGTNSMYRDSMQDIIKISNDKEYPIYGELSHSTTLDINFSKVSHSIENINYGTCGNILADISVLNTIEGMRMKDMAEEGIVFNYSARSTGTYNSDGSVNIKKIYGFDVIGIDEEATRKRQRELLIEARKRKIALILENKDK